ncbi:hypothetical protein ABUW04_31990 [Streptacidiphilus sp. N1-10]|uniref:Uncharacterized protein n=1 Tax=Streptacidiphilus jeojiensis TaxID=3229225 RepID=A0ABV6XXA7_9ACTN
MQGPRHIFGHFTATRTRWMYDDEGSPIEEPEQITGWVDWGWNSRLLHESRNYVRPYVTLSEDDPDLYDEIRDAFNLLPGGPTSEGSRGTYYAADTYSPIDGDDCHFSYALHFTCKYLGLKGWVEEPWEPDMSKVAANA